MPDSYVPLKARQRAHGLVQRAIRRGALIRADHCERCGDPHSKPIAHHDDYEKPLNVRWLCGRCHNRVHGNRTFEWETAFGRGRCPRCGWVVYIHLIDNGRAQINDAGEPEHIGDCPTR